ncbi:MAG: hypothetical protein ABSF97_06215 [Candidatus Sulfotelmatobacter sp.]|jgi:hypothetical protein
MSANASVLGRPEVVRSSAQEEVRPCSEGSCVRTGWDRQDFAREQILGLVRRAFLNDRDPKVRQIVFSPLEAHSDITSICAQAAQTLAVETGADVALVEGMPIGGEVARGRAEDLAWIKGKSIRTATNLWRVPNDAAKCVGKPNARVHWLSFLADLRREFEYCVIQGPVASTASDAALLGQLTDGIILVLGANSTRKAAARNVKKALQGAQSRILGTVLSDRKFPVPEQLYRRL